MNLQDLISTIRLPNWRLSAVLGILFVVTQTVALLHAETHAFHDNTELCAVYQAAEHHPGVAGSTMVVTGVVAFAEGSHPHPQDDVRQRASNGFQARAPPLFISIDNV